ncbi:NADH-quinone oxidoreductase subunit J [Desertihabitans brevis]|uniref:NADH-quinone oxidoreductase subunit J n=1 Tax=Desertihabitans brevis TaxID=2268447 RepID=A0A367YVL0_9ACTN|nr:NADH-quinone oxidoreductase subunit J [Desertihabitans brevis]RCK69830.1 NADH-quinone oxidoreductase subunit J [Desertihabitans brevis]
MVLGAVGMVLARKAVHSALCLAAVMICLAIQYAALDAPFLFAVQIIVYTGAILMLFLFVVMLVGVDSDDSFVETLRGQRVFAVLLGVGLVVLLVAGLGNAVVTGPAGLTEANAQYGGNVQGLAALVFVRWVWAFEATSALLITAAVGAMVLTHRERLAPRRDQRTRAAERMQAYAETGRHPGPLPTPGVFARHNAVDTPALLPDGSVAEDSVSATLRSRSRIRTPEELLAPMAQRHAEIAGDRQPDPAVGHQRDPRPGESVAEQGAALKASQRTRGEDLSDVERGEQLSDEERI